MKGSSPVNLDTLGWNAHFEAFFNMLAGPHHIPGRVAATHRDRWHVLTAAGTFDATLAGRLRHAAAGLPATGDWAVLAAAGADQAVIHALLPRRTALVRRAPGAVERPQVLASNVDVAFLVIALDAGFSVRRLERALTLVWECGAEPVVVLSKGDLCGDVAARRREAEEAARGAAVHVTTLADAGSFDALHLHLGPGRTAVVLGASGAGKSTLVNRLLGEERLATGEVRAADGKGRHTTSRRELIALPRGGVLIDTPGLRELQLWASDDALDGVFDDIAALAAGCHFRDCTHSGEPGCAVAEAVRAGALAPERLASHAKLRREMTAHRRRTDPRARAEERRWQREVNHVLRQHAKRR